MLSDSVSDQVLFPDAGRLGRVRVGDGRGLAPSVEGGVASRSPGREGGAHGGGKLSLVTGTGRCQSPRLDLVPVVLGDGGNVRLLNHVRLVSDEEAEMRREFQILPD